PAVVDPQHRDESEAKLSEGKTSRRQRRGKVTAGLRQSDRQCQNRDEQQGACLGEGSDVLYERAPFDSDIVEGRREHDGDGGDVVHVPAVRMGERIVAEVYQVYFLEVCSYWLER